MRKKLDEEMPERALFWFRRRGLIGALPLLLSLSLGALWMIAHRGGHAGLRSRIAKQANAVKGARTGSGEEPGNAAKTGEATKTGDGTKRGGTSHLRGDAMRVDVARVADAEGLTCGTKSMYTRVEAEKVTVDSKLAITGSWREDIPGPKLITPAKKLQHIKKPEKPVRSEKLKPGDSTRLLWAVGLADSKSFPVGAQQPVDYNANLRKDLLFDYVPTPYFQYHPSRKIALQVAIQFNSPQYTEAVTIFRQPGPNSNVGSPYTLDTVTLVKKLYYFNFPLIVYYTPFKSLYLGTGLQYSNLRNGVAFQNNVIHYTGPGPGVADSVQETKLITLKDNRPAYDNLKKSEWRAVFEASYYWKRVTLGLQYQQALGDYLHVPVPGSAGKDRNSSFNLYLRYNIRERWVRISR